MEFIKKFNQIAIFAVLLTVFGGCGLIMLNQARLSAQCPADKTTYRSICTLARTMNQGYGDQLDDEDRQACYCASVL